MTAENHVHKWECLRGTLLTCNQVDCNTVTEIGDLLANTVASTKLQTKIDVLAAQLFAGELKKDAHGKAYAWVRQHSPDTMKPAHRQESLL